MAHLGHRPAHKLLVNLGQLARHDDAQLRAPDGFQIRQRVENAMRRLIKDQCARRFPRFCSQLLQSRSTRAGLLRQKSKKLELFGRQPRGDPAR